MKCLIRKFLRHWGQHLKIKLLWVDVWTNLGMWRGVNPILEQRHESSVGTEFWCQWCGVGNTHFHLCCPLQSWIQTIHMASGPGFCCYMHFHLPFEVLKKFNDNNKLNSKKGSYQSVMATVIATSHTCIYKLLPPVITSGVSCSNLQCRWSFHSKTALSWSLPKVSMSFRVESENIEIIS